MSADNADTVEVKCPKCHGRPWEPHTWADPAAKSGGCSRCWGTGRVFRRVLASKRKVSKP